MTPEKACKIVDDSKFTAASPRWREVACVLRQALAEAQEREEAYGVQIVQQATELGELDAALEEARAKLDQATINTAATCRLRYPSPTGGK